LTNWKSAAVAKAVKKAERIAFVTPRFSEGATIGGAETLLKSLAVHAAASGRSVTILTTCAQDHFTWENTLPPGSKTVNGIEVIFFPVDEDRDIDAFLRTQTTISSGRAVSMEEENTWIENNVNSRALCEHLQQNGDNYDSIVAGPYLFGLIYHAAMVHPKKTVLVPCLHDEAFAYLSVFERLFNTVGALMFNTAPEMELARRLYKPDPDAMSVVGMGLDSFDCDPNAFSRQQGIKTPYVIYSGRREQLKGTPLLIDYMTTFRSRTGHDIKLVLTGSGPVDCPAELRPHLIDVGFVTEDEKHNAMAGALAFCHPSVNESLGIVILEAWLAETPCLVHEKAAVLRDHCVKGGGGLWFKTYPEFEAELSLLLDNRNARDQLAAAGKRYVMENYRWDRITDKMLNVLDA
jgi:glycosyltransferase involved in cell wall biosynthesis